MNTQVQPRIAQSSQETQQTQGQLHSANDGKTRDLQTQSPQALEPTEDLSNVDIRGAWNRTQVALAQQNVFPFNAAGLYDRDVIGVPFIITSAPVFSKYDGQFGVQDIAKVIIRTVDFSEPKAPLSGPLMLTVSGRYVLNQLHRAPKSDLIGNYVWTIGPNPQVINGYNHMPAMMLKAFNPDTDVPLTYEDDLYPPISRQAASGRATEDWSPQERTHAQRIAAQALSQPLPQQTPQPQTTTPYTPAQMQMRQDAIPAMRDAHNAGHSPFMQPQTQQPLAQQTQEHSALWNELASLQGQQEVQQELRDRQQELQSQERTRKPRSDRGVKRGSRTENAQAQSNPF